MNTLNAIESAVFISLVYSLLPKDLLFRTFSNYFITKLWLSHFMCFTAEERQKGASRSQVVFHLIGPASNIDKAEKNIQDRLDLIQVRHNFKERHYYVR